ncbi:MAG: phycobilisome protein, partial [Microcystaceae cyanobacterium]
MQLSEKAKQLIPKARIVSFESWKSQYSPEVIAIFQQADDEGRYLTPEDIDKLLVLVPPLATACTHCQLLTQAASEITSAAREQVLANFPKITDEGGELYPPARAEACWRDFWHFLRCISYGIAAQRDDFTSSSGLANMALLYQELKVPLPAMILGVESLKAYSVEKIEEKELDPYFD